MTQIALLDYGMGNLHSAAKALEYVGANVIVTNDPAAIARADKIVFPGVGAMRDCMQGMRDAGIDQIVGQMAFHKPILAICVGMQALMRWSDENNGVACLNLFEGDVKRFDASMGFKVPHMGWNEITPNDHALWHGIAAGTRFYFVHSYYTQPTDTSIIAAQCQYGIPFCAALAKDNLFAVQFHPEKSNHAGLQLLKNFVHWNI